MYLLNVNTEISSYFKFYFILNNITAMFFNINKRALGIK